ncbi:MAG: hypothetical protein Q4G58_15260 [bacterium]|nr:hypothetical protein [bacterium]
MDTEQGFTYKDYQEKKHGDYQSVGLFGDSVYAYEQLTGFANTHEYRQITKKEFETFEQWSKEDVKDLGLLAEVRGRDILCSGHKGETSFRESQKEVTCPVCKTTFLLPEEDIPDEEDLYIYCPNCNKPLDQKLVDEIKQQLNKLTVELEGLVTLLRTYYINPRQPYDKRGYVEIEKEMYHLKMQEHGKVIRDDKVTEIKEATYWILSQLLPVIEERALKNEQNEKKREKKVRKAVEADFEKMDECYKNWFTDKAK